MRTYFGYFLACVFIFFAVGADLLDGFVARRMKQFNDLGKQLDSLSDAVCFGVMPAILAFQLFTDNYSQLPFNNYADSMWIMFIPAFIFVTGAVSRLAYFNVSTNEGYTGLPTPLSAVFVGLTISVYYASYELTNSLNWFVTGIFYLMPLILIFLAWCNVTDKIYYGKNFRKKAGRLKYIFISLSSIIVALIIAGQFQFSGRHIVLFLGIMFLWGFLISFIIYGMINAYRIHKSPESESNENN
jgi:CDP-diacylglycerol--serine O-phosphatidyltransferase